MHVVRRSSSMIDEGSGEKCILASLVGLALQQRIISIDD